jgi:hypothetical protein
MSRLLTFDTGGQLSDIYQGVPHIPEQFIRTTAESVLPSTIAHLNESAVICGIVLEEPFNPASSSQQRLIRAFTDGGTIALGAARIELRRRHDELGIDDEEFAKIEEMLTTEQIGPFLVDKDVEVELEREGRIKSTKEQYGHHASDIVRLLRLSYDMERSNEGDIFRRKTVAALGFSVIAPQIDRAAYGYLRFKTQLEKMIQG